MSVLVVYASWKGSTREVAGAVAETLRNAGVDARTAEAAEVRDLDGVHGLVLGSAVRAGRCHPDQFRFLRRHRNRIAEIPVAVFAVCMTAREGAAKCEVPGFIRGMRKYLGGREPAAVGVFGGMIDTKRFSPLMRWTVRLMGFPEGDFRDWGAIRAWAGNLAPVFQVIMEVPSVSRDSRSQS